MKNLIFFFVLSLLSDITLCDAQDNNFSKSLVHGNKQNYRTNELIPHHKYINNTNNHLYKSKELKDPSSSTHVRYNDIHYDKIFVAQIFYKVFSQERLKKLANEDLNLQVNYNTDLQGNVLEISFSFADDSSITPMEIEKLEEQLKKEVKFTLNQDVFKGHNYVHINTFINFKRLVNNDPTAVFP